MLVELASQITAPQIYIAAFTVFALLVGIKASKKAKAPLFPGPKGIPFFGNTLQIPTHKPWLKFTEWNKQFGDIIHLSIIGPSTSIIVLAKVEDALAMLERKGANYSERPTFMMSGVLLGWNQAAVLSSANERWRLQRKEMHQFMGTNAQIAKYQPQIEEQARKLAYYIMKKPSSWQEQIRATPGATILRLVYGYEAQPENDPLIQLADMCLEQFSEATEPGKFLVDSIPALQYVPSWFPGAGFKRTAMEWKRNVNKMLNTPYEYAKKEIAAGTALPSYIRDKIAGTDEDIAKWVAISLYGGASDTTVVFLMAFILAVMKHPEAMRKGQEEIENAIGDDRLPTLDDRPSLPYVNAMIQETARWHVGGPLGLCHASDKDDVYKGHLIPAKSIIFVNVWKIFRDPNVYKNPEAYMPERFLGPNPELDPARVNFGFGRRVCPGRLLADATLFTTCATLLAVFKFDKPVVNGKVVEPVLNPGASTICRTGPFEVDFKPRSAKIKKLVEQSMAMQA